MKGKNTGPKSEETKKKLDAGKYKADKIPDMAEASFVQALNRFLNESL